MESERCKRCGDYVEQDELGWFCRGCDLRTDSRGRKTSRQPTRGQKALRRFKDREADKAAEAIEQVFGAGVTAEQQASFRRVVLRRKHAKPEQWCRPCDAWLVVRSSRVICWRCGEIRVTA